MKRVIGYVFWAFDKDRDKKIFEKIAKKKKIELVFFNLSENLNEKEIEKKAKKCHIIFNDSAEEFAIEIVKTLEALGKKVIDSSKIYYYCEDKWLFYLNCKENNIPTLNTILLSENLNLAKKELENFNSWPVVLKRIEGSNGEYVEKADNIQEALNILKKFWKKEAEKFPIIAQEFVDSPCYRITVIGNKIVQTAVRQGTHWKKTGNHAKRFRKIKIDSELKKLTKKIIKIFKINICGIDLLKKDGKWKVLEINSCPGIDFFNNQREKMAEDILDFLVKISNKRINKLR